MNSIVKQKILIVEDNKTNMNILSKILSALEYEIFQAYTGENALVSVTKIAPDLILLDVILPGMDGFEICRCLKAMDKIQEIPVIFVTAMARLEDLAKGFEVGGIDYITKPVKKLEVQARVRTHLRIQALVQSQQQALAALAESKNRLAKIFRYSNDAILLVDPSGNQILDGNEMACQLLGFSYKELLTVKPFCIHKHQIQAFSQFMQSVFKKGDGWTDSLSCKPKNGPPIPTEISASAIELDGRPCIIAIIHDISERLRVEQELRDTRDKALAANRAKSVFLANMSHEIRTPMNAVLGFSQIMLYDPKFPEKYREAISTIDQAGNHLLELIDGILDLSKVEAGGMELTPKDFDLGLLLEGMSDIFKPRCQVKNLKFRLEHAMGIGLAVYADQGKIRQILINLLGNATKFTNSGQVILRASKQEEHYTFEVIDTGPGIPQDQQKVIFQPFRQTEEGQKKGGTGLGLAIAKRQSELMGGTLTLTSQLGQGAHFRLCLSMPSAKKEVASRSRRKTIAHIATDKPITALIVDDIKNNRIVLSCMLKNMGVNVQQANNGLEALAALRKSPPDIIWMDIVMPIMDGMTALQHIRKEFTTPRIPCVAISASTMLHQQQDYKEAGFDRFMPKPFRFGAVYQALQECLGIEFKNAEAQALPWWESNLQKSVPANLSVALQNNLRKAANIADISSLETLINQMKETEDKHMVALAEHFTSLTKRYKTNEILRTLDKIGRLG